MVILCILSSFRDITPCSCTVHSACIQLTISYINTHLHYYMYMYMYVLHDRYLMVPSKDYRVLVVEPLLSPSHFRNTLARALFNHFSVRIDV